MKNLIIKIQRGDMLINYINSNIDNLPKLHHKLRVKQVLFSELFHVYHDGMNFKNSNIICDNRNIL